VGFADLDDERVKFVVVAGEGGTVFMGALGRKGLLGEGLDVGVFGFFRCEAVADYDAAQIFVDDHGGRIEGVEQDGIGGFGTDAGKGEQLLADGKRRSEGSRAEGFDVAAVARIEKGNEGLEGCRFAEHESGGADEVTKVCFGDCAQAVDREDAARFEIGDGALDTFPGGVLCEVCADDDFEGGLGWPPLLRAEALDEVLVHRTQSTCRLAPIGVCGSRVILGHHCLRS
jgi:hypothetical protein